MTTREERFGQTDIGQEHNFVLPHIKVGAGGSLQFTDSDGESFKTVTGTVVLSCIGRMFWEHAYGEGESGPPACISNDGIVGIGDPGEQCATCHLSQRGDDGREPCQEVRRLLIDTEEMGPVGLTLKPGSIWPWDIYCSKLRGKGERYYSVTTKLSLVKAQNRGGISYAKLAPEEVAVLPDADLDVVLVERERMLPLLVGAHSLQIDAPSNEDDDGYYGT